MLKTYRRNGKLAYLDPIRAFLIEAKPEETVRQTLLVQLMSAHGVPMHAIAVEFPMTKGGGTSRRRADVVVRAADGRMLLVIECKEPTTPLHDGVLEQARAYAEELQSRFFAMTNGAVTEAYEWHANRWHRLAAFPSFDQLHQGGPLPRREPDRRSFPPLTDRQLGDHEFLSTHDGRLADQWGYIVIGQDWKRSRRSAADRSRRAGEDHSGH